MWLKIIFILTILSFALATQKAESCNNATYILIHGSNVGGWNYYKVQTLLEARGHTVITFDLPAMGVNKDNVTYITLQDHVNSVLNILDGVGEPAFVVGHSYGGVVLSEVAEARPELVKAAVYLSAFMLQNNQSLLEARLGNPTPAPADASILSYNDQGIPISFSYNMSYFVPLLCEGCSQTDVNLANSLFVAQPLSTWETPITIGTNYDSVKKVYISALQDKSIPPALQEAMYSQFPDTEVFKIESPHMVPLYDPEGLAKILNSLAE